MQSAQSNRRDALAPQTVLRDYTIEAVLGHGGFGIVYRARHNDLGHLVAIKEYLPADLAIREEGIVVPRSSDCVEHYSDGLRRFRDEAKALINLSHHPNVIACRDFLRGNGTAYLVMDFVDGQPLSRVLRERETEGHPFDEADLLAVAMPLAEGLAHVHRAGLLHRDVKPANILIRRDDQSPVLIDFGAAKHSFEDSTKSLAPYTDGYAAQEQVADGKLGPWTDMYGYGGVLWRMVVGGNQFGHPPRLAKVESRMNARLSGDDDPLYSARVLGAHRFSERILKVIDKCLELDINKRIRDSGEVVTVLSDNAGSAQNVDSPAFGDCSESYSEDPSRFPSTSSGSVYPFETSSSRPVEVEGLLDTKLMASILIYVLLASICLCALQTLGTWTIFARSDANSTVLISTWMAGFFHASAFMVSAILFLTLTYHSSCNAHILAAREGMKLRFSPIWSVGSYFVPVAFLWKPYFSMKEILAVIAPESALDRKKSRRPLILPIWWTLWMLSNSFQMIISAYAYSVDLSTDRAIAMGHIRHLLEASSSLACLLLVRMLRDLQTKWTSHTNHNQAPWGLVVALTLIGIMVQVDAVTGLNGILGPAITLQLALALTSWLSSLFFFWPILLLLASGALFWLLEALIFLPVRAAIIGAGANTVTEIQSYSAEYIISRPISIPLSIIASVVSLGTFWTGGYLLLLAGLVLFPYGGKRLWKSIAQ